MTGNILKNSNNTDQADVILDNFDKIFVTNVCYITLYTYTHTAQQQRCT